MPGRTYKLTTLVGESPESIEAAVATALATSAGKVHGQQWIQVKDIRASVNEGGAIHVDGEGTVLLTDTVQLGKGRNPDWTREQVEAQAKLYQAKAEYEKVMAEAHRIERESKAKAAKEEAETKVIQAQARQAAADARIREKAARLVEALLDRCLEEAPFPRPTTAASVAPARAVAELLALSRTPS